MAFNILFHSLKMPFYDLDLDIHWAHMWCPGRDSPVRGTVIGLKYAGPCLPLLPKYKEVKYKKRKKKKNLIYLLRVKMKFMLMLNFFFFFMRWFVISLILTPKSYEVTMWRSICLGKLLSYLQANEINPHTHALKSKVVERNDWDILEELRTLRSLELC